MDTRLQVQHLNKAYTVPVLVDFDIELRPGEVHALMGSNGAGKTTFAKILTGLVEADSGELRIDGQPYLPRSKAEAEANGVVMVLQELNVIPTLSIAENLFFNRLPSSMGFVSRKSLREKSREALEQVQLQHLDPDMPAGRLGIGQQQLIEIASALSRSCRLLILDEPTAALTDPEMESLFAHIRRLTAKGAAVLYISHRMDEIRQIADRITVMRDGRRISTHDAGDVTQDVLVREMAGRDIMVSSRERHDSKPSEVVLEARQLQVPPKLDKVSFQLHGGEILGLAGLVGCGRSECLRALFGADPVRGGEILIGGNPVRLSHPADAVRHGIGMVPEDRKSDGLLLEQSIRVNATLATADLYSKNGVYSKAAEHEAVLAGAGKLDLKHDHIEQAVNQLSGGNQQKVVMLRWLLRNSRILLLDEPTRGIDVAAKEAVYKLLRELSRQGKAVLVVSSEFLELMSLCDRILVLSGGTITDEFRPDNWSQQKITHAAFSSYMDRGKLTSSKP